MIRSEVLSAAEMNALTENEAALLAVVAKEAEAGAAGSLLAGANLNKARGEAITLTRELATGGANARTMGALLGSFGPTLTIAGIAAFAIVEGIKGAVEAAEKFDRDVANFTKGISDAVTETNRLARESETLGDTIRISDKWTVELAQVEVKMAEFRARQLGFWASFVDAIVKYFAEHMNALFAKIPGLDSITLDTRGPFQRGADADIAAANTAAKQALQNANEALETSARARSDWAKAMADPAVGLGFYTTKISELQAKLDTIDRSTLDGQKQFNATLHELDDATSKADQLGNQLDKNNKTIKGGTGEIVAFGREVAATIQAIRQQQQLVDANIRLGPEDKNAATIENTRQEITLLNGEVEKGRGLMAGGTLDPATYAQVNAGVQKTTFEVALLNEKLDKLQHPIFASLSEWVTQLGTAAQQVGREITTSITTALDSAASALTDIIFRTGNWRQTMLNAEKAIVGSLIKIGLQMIVQAVLGKFLTEQNKQSQIQAGGQIAAAHAPAAAATSISSFGSAAIIGGIAAAAAIALIIGLLAGGFEGGGYTGSGPRKRIAGVVHGDEFVHDSPTTNLYGRDFHQALLEHRIPVTQARALLGNYRYTPIAPRLGSFEVGGAVAAIEASSNDRAASAGAGGPVTIKGFKTVVLNDVAKLRKEILDSDEAVVFVIDAVTGNAHLVKGAIASS